MSRIASNTVISRRRWLTFGVRSLLVAITIAAVVLESQLRIVRARQKTLAMVKERDGRGAVSFPVQP